MLPIQMHSWRSGERLAAFASCACDMQGAAGCRLTAGMWVVVRLVAVVQLWATRHAAAASASPPPCTLLRLLLLQGKVGMLLLAGGQGTRLGSKLPKVGGACWGCTLQLNQLGSVTSPVFLLCWLLYPESASLQGT